MRWINFANRVCVSKRFVRAMFWSVGVLWLCRALRMLSVSRSLYRYQWNCDSAVGSQPWGYPLLKTELLTRAWSRCFMLCLARVKVNMSLHQDKYEMHPFEVLITYISFLILLSVRLFPLRSAANLVWILWFTLLRMCYKIWTSLQRNEIVITFNKMFKHLHEDSNKNGDAIMKYRLYR